MKIAKRALTVVLFCLASVAVHAQTVSAQWNNTPLNRVLEDIENQTHYSFAYNYGEIDSSFRVTGSFRNAPLADVLSKVLPPNTLYTINGKIISLTLSQTRPQSTQKKSMQTIAGTVISGTDNQPLPGVVVMVKGGTTGTQTDLDGNYSLTVPSDAVVQFQCMGYETREYAAKDAVLMKLVSMSDDSNMLKDAIVVGFGVQKKQSVVGAIQAINPQQLNYPSSNLTTAFAGKIAGVISTQKSGEPGADGANFWIRGISTFGTNTSPLIVMDGVEITATMLNSIAPETIESFSVLKDATATALYGSRGANGVMIITTKNGRDSDKMNVNLRVENGWSMPTSVQKIADGVTYMQAFNEAVGMEYYPSEKIDGTRNGLDPLIYPDIDWYSTLFKKATMNQNVNLNVTGGGKRVDYFLNATVFNENGILRDSDDSPFGTNINYKKFLFQNNITARITPTTRLSVRMNTQLHYRHAPYESVNNLFYYTMRANPVKFPVVWPREEEDTFVRFGNVESPNGGTNDINPYALMCRGFGDRHYSYFTETVNLDQDLSFITEGLKLKGQASFYNYVYAATYKTLVPHYYKLVDYWTDASTGKTVYDTMPFGATPVDYYSISTGRDGYRENSYQASVEYTRRFNPGHDVNALLVYHQKEKVMNTPGSSENEVLPYREQGLAGRVTYGYKDRYLLEANFGYNGSENFARGHRFGFFPSIALGYNISNEPYFEPFKDVVSLLKVRVSYGQSGNDALPVRFPYVTEVRTGQSMYWRVGPEFTALTGTTISTLGNEDATWEVSTKANLGLEIGLFNDFTLIVDVFNDHRTGIFMQRRSIPFSAGYSDTLPYGNIGAVLNRGVDASFEYNKVVNPDFTISARGAFTYAHNEVTDRDEPRGIARYQSEIGFPINSVVGLVADGLFADQEDIDSSPVHTFQAVRPGDIKYVDLNADGRIDGNDETVIGMPTSPEIVYGFGGSAVWHKFDLSFFFQGQARCSILMSNMHPFCDKGVSGFGITKWIADSYWRESNPNPSAEYPRLSADWNQNNVKTSTFWMRNGAFLRLKTVEFGYTYKFMRAYVTGSNLLTFAPFKHWDPGLGSGNGLSYPLQRTFNVGLQINF